MSTQKSIKDMQVRYGREQDTMLRTLAEFGRQRAAQFVAQEGSQLKLGPSSWLAQQRRKVHRSLQLLFDDAYTNSAL